MTVKDRAGALSCPVGALALGGQNSLDGLQLCVQEKCAIRNGEHSPAVASVRTPGRRST